MHYPEPIFLIKIWLSNTMSCTFPFYRPRRYNTQCSYHHFLAKSNQIFFVLRHSIERETLLINGRGISYHHLSKHIWTHSLLSLLCTFVISNPCHVPANKYTQLIFYQEWFFGRQSIWYHRKMLPAESYNIEISWKINQFFYAPTLAKTF